MTSKRTEARWALERAESEAARRTKLDEFRGHGRVGFPKPDPPLTEADLHRGYSRSTLEPLERPERRYYDESGLVYGEPISKGRTDLQRGKEQ